MSSECLLRHFSTYGEIEEGPFGLQVCRRRKPQGKSWAQYGGPRGLSSHGGFPQVGGGVAVLPQHQHPFSIGGPALTTIGSRAPPSLGSGGAYVGGTGGAYGVGSQYGGPRSGESSQHRKRLGCCDYWFSRHSSFACDLFVILLVFG
ncbi:hypothetical protein AAG906_028758 [Vitis piasezkii]